MVALVRGCKWLDCPCHTPNEVKKYDAHDANADMASLHDEIKKESSFVAVEGGPFLTLIDTREDGALVVSQAEMRKYQKALLKSDRERIRSRIEALKWDRQGIYAEGYDDAIKTVLKLISDN